MSFAPENLLTVMVHWLPYPFSRPPVFHDLNSARASERLQPEELRNKLQE